MADDKRKPRPKAPDGLQAPGKSLWRKMVAAYEFEVGELPVLGLACHQADDIAALERLIANEGLVISGSRGQPRMNSALTEVRQGRLVLAKLLGQLALPGEDERPMSVASLRAKKAADSRWSQERARRERPIEGRFRGSA